MKVQAITKCDKCGSSFQGYGNKTYCSCSVYPSENCSPVEVNALVNIVCEKIHLDILQRIAGFEQGQRFLIYSRIVTRLVQNHFGFIMKYGDEKSNEPV